MKRHRAACVVILALLIALPLIGVWLAGGPVSQYVEFPPRTGSVDHPSFSWPVFLLLASMIIASLSPFVIRVSVSNRRPAIPGSEPCTTSTHSSALSTPHEVGLFPWWGWCGMGWIGLWWVLAWTRWPWMAWVQEDTFTPLWVGYVVVVNAWTFARTGHCMMLHRPRYFLSLFPLSAAFWWCFEYLNRFVQNWHYVGVAELSPLEYVLRATIPFSTVLPAVFGTAELLTSFPGTSAGLAQFRPIRVEHSKSVGWSVLLLSSAGLLGIGLWPNVLFPLVWVGPLLLILSIQTLAGHPTIIVPLAHGDWRQLWVFALAALICGGFWELWNWQSVAHWEYRLPFVHRFQVFEMPLLGYAGYLPFGLESLAVAEMCLTRQFAGGVEYYRTGTRH